jgi:hypothetical protein
MSASEATKEAIYLDSLLTDIDPDLSGTVPITVSDTSVSGPYDLNHDKTKHIERRHLWMQELETNDKVVFPFVKEVDNTASFFTEPLAAKAFIYMRNQVMNVGSRATSGREERGGVAAL